MVQWVFLCPGRNPPDAKSRRRPTAGRGSREACTRAGRTWSSSSCDAIGRVGLDGFCTCEHQRGQHQEPDHRSRSRALPHRHRWYSPSLHCTHRPEQPSRLVPSHQSLQCTHGRVSSPLDRLSRGLRRKHRGGHAGLTNVSPRAPGTRTMKYRAGESNRRRSLVAMIGCHDAGRLGDLHQSLRGSGDFGDPCGLNVHAGANRIANAARRCSMAVGDPTLVLVGQRPDRWP